MHRLLLFTSLTVAAAATPRTDLLYGHFELHVDYAANAPNPDNGWRISASYDRDDDFSTAAGVVRMDPEDTVFVASPTTRKLVPTPAGALGRFGPPGTPLWILPQNNTLGSLFLGVRTTMPAGLFQARVGNNYTPSAQGSISLRLVSVTGSGPDAGGKFATWKVESLGTSVFSFDTTDGITAADEIATIPVSSHTHYNWGFTKPGIYHVTLEAKGKLMPVNGPLTSAQKTFTFAVPFSSRIGGGAVLQAAAGSDGLPVMIAVDPAGSVGYAADRVMLEATTPATAAGLILPGAKWELKGALSSLAGSVLNGVGIAPAVVSAGLPPDDWSNVAFEISAVRGPGNFALIETGGVLADGVGDVIPVPVAATSEITAAFTETGLYRITAILRGSRQGEPVASPPVTLVFGAGLTAEHDYAAWQSSFERTAGLPAGTLANQASDYDHDGIANGVEFAFFWQGLDPTRSDAVLMPRAFRTSEGFGAIDFLRDTFKDPLNGTSWQIRPSASTDLITWQQRSAAVPGFPLELAETGAEEGNAHGRILKRRLRLMPAPQDRAFFRFSITSP